MDLTKLSDADLMALQSGVLTKVSDAGLASLSGGASKAPPKVDSVGQTFGDLAAGAVRGAGSIGATLLAPYDIAKDAFSGKGLSLESNRERRAAMDQALGMMGANPDSGAYKVGKFGGEVAGTAGVGGLLARGTVAIPTIAKFAPGVANQLQKFKGLSAITKNEPLLKALESGGMASGKLIPNNAALSAALRAGGGATTGAVTAGMVNPEEADMGAAFGAALPIVRGGAGLVGTGIKKAVGASTGVGDEALSQAFQAGKAGGQKAQSFRDAITGAGSMDDVLSSVRQNLDAMGQQKQQAYRSGMVNIKNDKTVLDFADIDNAIKNAVNLSTFKGQVKNPEAAEALQKVRDQIFQWRSLDPKEYHTPEGLDALKQSISGMLDGISYEQKTARKAVGDIYNAVKQTINKQAPEYAKVMKEYADASELTREIERALVGGNKATAESSMRKLQSLMRNNVNTSYGYKTKLAEQLQNAGGQDIMAPLAGQALAEWTPRGVQRAAVGPTSALAFLSGGLPAAIGSAAVSSPRLMGEAAYGLGRASSVPNQELINALRQGLVTGAPVLAGQ